MTKLPFNQHIADLVSLLKFHGIRNVVICPGSRNAPLIQVFYRDRSFNCHSIVDERSAAYLAMGMARESGKAVVVLTTSGTAALNLAPAVAESFNLHIPLIVLTADRPAEFPPQFTNQRITQDGIFHNHTKASGSFSLKEDSLQALRLTILDTHRLLQLALHDIPGPLHLNIPLEEPLYEQIADGISQEQLRELLHSVPYPESTQPAGDASKISRAADQEASKNEAFPSGPENKEIIEQIKRRKKILILAGLHAYNTEEIDLLKQLLEKTNVTILSENLANLPEEIALTSPELILAAADDDDLELLRPELIILFGGQVVSKQARLYVQGLEQIPVKVYEKFPAEMLKEAIHATPSRENLKNIFLTGWKKKEEIVLQKAKSYLKEAEYSMLGAVHAVLDKIPGNATVHLGNSSVVRLAQLCQTRQDLVYTSNRGTSGIDGTLSAAAGAAMISTDLHIAIVGDLSFVYDSNALWNRSFPGNLKIVVMNDKGGGIFRLLDGPDRMPFFEDFSIASHPVSIKSLAEAFQINYYISKNYKELRSALDHVFDDHENPSLLEVDLSESENSRIFKQFYKQIQSQ